MKAIEVFTKQDFIKYLKQIGARFEEHPVGNMDFVYVYSKEEYDNKAMFVPYLRVSHFEDDLWYVRNCGACDDYRPQDVCLMARDMTFRKGESA